MKNRMKRVFAKRELINKMLTGAVIRPEVRFGMIITEIQSIKI